jgi:P-type Mg2+ transporter
LYDFSQVPIPIDAVDEEQVARPRPWNIGEITRFIFYIGPISSIFDYTTFFVMLWVFNCWDPSPRASISDGLVRRVADDSDAHHSRHSHK